jgi:hypothetical protein
MSLKKEWTCNEFLKEQHRLSHDIIGSKLKLKTVSYQMRCVKMKHIKNLPIQVILTLKLIYNNMFHFTL